MAPGKGGASCFWTVIAGQYDGGGENLLCEAVFCVQKPLTLESINSVELCLTTESVMLEDSRRNGLLVQ